jgi:hypothetical protein
LRYDLNFTNIHDMSGSFVRLTQIHATIKFYLKAQIVYRIRDCVNFLNLHEKPVSFRWCMESLSFRWCMEFDIKQWIRKVA